MLSFSRSSKNESLNTSLVGTQLRPLLIEAADLLGVAPRNPLRLYLLNVVVLGLPFARNCRTLSPFRFNPASFFGEIRLNDIQQYNCSLAFLASNGKCFFALLHDSHAKRPARCERLRCLHRDSTHWAYTRCFVNATKPKDTCKEATSLSYCFRVD